MHSRNTGSVVRAEGRRLGAFGGRFRSIGLLAVILCGFGLRLPAWAAEPPNSTPAGPHADAPPAAAPAPEPAGKAVPRFTVNAWEISGNTLLTEERVRSIFQKFGGTNTVVNDIIKAGETLQMEYRDRGYPTVSVSIPAQNITSNNGVVKILVFEGRLSQIDVVNNRYFTSNNVLRALPSLHRDMILNGPVFQAELDRANANQDRQIYPQIAPGSETNTTMLTLTVKDRLPLHAKIDFNNQNSPGTPDLRVNSSVVYNNLWQREHSLGFQYGFSPEEFKPGNGWDFYDAPAVANYSTFYRLPLGSPDSVSDVLAQNPGSFGYSEATRSFRMPAPSGAKELNIYATRATIDTGVDVLSSEEIYNVPGVRQVIREDVQQDVTLNEGLGARLSMPLPEFYGVRSTLSLGLDYKNYELTSYKTNNFHFIEYTVDETGQTNPPVISTVSSPVPTTRRAVSYVPFSLRWDASVAGSNSFSSLALNFAANPMFAPSLFEGSETNFAYVSGSPQSDGKYHLLTLNVAHERDVFKGWRLALRADGQWADQPLVSNEQFGAGGLGSVHGYHEGEVFGDLGWRVGAEQKTPPHVIGYVNGKDPLTFRASAFMEYAEVYLLDPLGRPDRTPLWGTGVGFIAGIGTHWEARLIFSWPLLSTTTTTAGQPRFDFGLSAQF